MAYQQKRGGRPTMSRPRSGGFSGGRRGGGNRGPAKKYINPAKFTNKATAKADEIPYESTHQFADFPFGAQLHHNIATKGYKTPSAIQDQAIPHIINGCDVIGLANTGTGKTAAFLLPILERQSGIMLRPSVLIMAPTRELAQQIDEQFREFSKGLNLYSALVVGGMNIDRQIRDLRRRPHLIIGTPGRLKDLLQRRELQLKNMTTLVLDEADRMLDMGFLPQLKTIFKALPKIRQTYMFSATFPNNIRKLSAEFLHNPVEVAVGEPSTPVHKISQSVIETTHKEKNDILLDELNSRQGSVLIFTRTKHRTDRLTRYLAGYGYRVTLIHGDRSQSQRRSAIEGFRKGEFRILVATDIAARGLDIADIGHVINYDLPQVAEDYVHRIGRTARNGKQGQALCLLTPEDRGMWRTIAKLTQYRAPEKTPGEQSREHRQNHQPKRDPSYRQQHGKSHSGPRHQSKSEYGSGNPSGPRRHGKHGGRRHFGPKRHSHSNGHSSPHRSNSHPRPEQ
jgi:superfamily II DNA/RNA helicase